MDDRRKRPSWHRALGYPTRTRAIRVAVYQSKHGRVAAEPYRCASCLRWHVGTISYTNGEMK